MALHFPPAANQNPIIAIGNYITVEVRFRFFFYGPVRRVAKAKEDYQNLLGSLRYHVTLTRHRHETKGDVLRALSDGLIDSFSVPPSYADPRGWIFWTLDERRYDHHPRNPTSPFVVVDRLPSRFPFLPLTMVDVDYDNRRGTGGGVYSLACTVCFDTGPPALEDLLMWLQDAEMKGRRHWITRTDEVLGAYREQRRDEMWRDTNSPTPYMAAHKTAPQESNTRPPAPYKPANERRARPNDDRHCRVQVHPPIRRPSSTLPDHVIQSSPHPSGRRLPSILDRTVLRRSIPPPPLPRRSVELDPRHQPTRTGPSSSSEPSMPPGVKRELEQLLRPYTGGQSNAEDRGGRMTKKRRRSEHSDRGSSEAAPETRFDGFGSTSR